MLAAASRFFRALFAGHWAQQAQQPAGRLQPVALSGVDGASLQLLLHAIYSKRLPLTAEGAAEEAAMLLGAANYLEVRAGWVAVQRLALSVVTVAVRQAVANGCSGACPSRCPLFGASCYSVPQ